MTTREKIRLIIEIGIAVAILAAGSLYVTRARGETAKPVVIANL